MQEERQPPARRRPPRQAALPSTFGILLFVGLFAAAIVAMGWANSTKRQRQADARQEAEQQAEFDPFAEMHEKAGTKPLSSSDTPDGSGQAGGGSKSESAWGGATGPEDDPVWQAALELGRKADGLLAEAKKANLSGDRDTFKAKGNAAKDAYDQALVDTYELEESLVAEHGDTSRVASSVRRKREAWTDNLVALRKTVPR